MASRRNKLVLLGLGALLLIGAAIVVLQPVLLKVFQKLRSYILLPVYRGPIEADGSYTNIIFLHHSTGKALIAEMARPRLPAIAFLAIGGRGTRM
jgi:hypothetical protein